MKLKTDKGRKKKLLTIDESASDLKSLSYITSNESAGNVFTRMDHDREMIIGFWSKGMFDHASIFVCYFSEKPECQVIGRVFSFELFTDKESKKNVLSIKGPIYNTSARKYDCTE